MEELQGNQIGNRLSRQVGGPTDLATRLRPIPGLDEEVHHDKVPCSPTFTWRRNHRARGVISALKACLATKEIAS